MCLELSFNTHMATDNITIIVMACTVSRVGTHLLHYQPCTNREAHTEDANDSDWLK